MGGSGSLKKGRFLAGVSSFLDSGKEDTTKGRNLGTLGGLNTMGFPSVNDILGLGRFSDNCGPRKRDMVFAILKRFHTANYTWRWGRLEYCTHHMLLFSVIGRCDMILSHRIMRGRSTARINRVGWWSSWVSVTLLYIVNWTTVIGLGR